MRSTDLAVVVNGGLAPGTREAVKVVFAFDVLCAVRAVLTDSAFDPEMPHGLIVNC